MTESNGVREMTWEEFLAEFKPIKNNIDDNTSYDGYLFETYGSEWRAVKQYGDTHPGCVWTLMSEGAVEWIAHGYHWVNRMGYFITEKPGNNQVEYFIDEDTFVDEMEVVDA